MVGADLVRMLLAAGLAVWHGSPPIVYGVAAGLSCGQMFFAPAALPLLWVLAVGQFLAALSAGATGALLVVLAEQRLGGGAAFGLLVAGIGLGAAAGPLLIVRRIRDPRRPLLVFVPYAVRGVVDLVLASVTALPAAVAVLVFYGLSTSTGTVTFSSLVQSWVPEQLRGRAFAGFDVIWQTGRLLSLLGGGLLAVRSASGRSTCSVDCCCCWRRRPSAASVALPVVTPPSLTPQGQAPRPPMTLTACST